jgi:NADPH:quinone reductase-like Zn-dependent oxidoreductase
VKAAIVDAPGSEPRLGQVSLPARTPGQTLVSVLAAPLNRLDLLVASGTFHSARHEDPYVPGSEFVGTVLESERYAVGARVYGECHPTPTTPGAFAEQVIVDDSDLIPLPDGLDAVRAAAVGNAGIAAYIPLVEFAGLRAGETVLVLGATGAVGQLAVQIARQHDAAHVIGVGRDAAALEQIRGLGADATVELREGEAIDALATRLVAAGAVDVIFDGLFGAPLEAALQACVRSARIVNVGNVAGATAQFPAGILRGKQLTIRGFAGQSTPLSDKVAGLTWLWAALADGRLGVDVQTFGLDELPSAWRGQADSPHAKYVILPAGADR